MVFSLHSYAQTGLISRDINVIPPSPTAYNLGLAGFVKNGLFTGAASVGIPLTEYSTPDLKVPVTLYDNSNGVKVEALSSRTGIDWNLNAGGAIVRLVRGEPDATNYNGPGPYGVMPEKVINEVGGDAADVTFRYYILQVAKGNIDSEYDLFSFNFMNHSGKFIITEKGEVLQETQSPLRIEAINGAVDNGLVITDDKGIRYVFTVPERTQVASGPDSRTPYVQHPGFYLRWIILWEIRSISLIGLIQPRFIIILRRIIRNLAAQDHFLQQLST